MTRPFATLGDRIGGALSRVRPSPNLSGRPVEVIHGPVTRRRVQAPRISWARALRNADAVDPRYLAAEAFAVLCDLASDGVTLPERAVQLIHVIERTVDPEIVSYVEDCPMPSDSTLEQARRTAGLDALVCPKCRRSSPETSGPNDLICSACSQVGSREEKP